MTCVTFNMGEFKHKISIERQTDVADGLGGFTSSWAADPAGGVWAKIKNLTGTERWEAQRLMPGNLVRVIIRWRADAQGNPYYTAQDRVVYQGRTYAILAVFEVDWSRQYIQIDMQEGKP